MMSLTNAKLKLEYPSAENENAVDSPATTQPTTQPAKPRIRLWTKQSSETRNPNSINLSGNQSGDFVPPGTFSNNAVKKLFGTSDTATLYVEGLTCSGNVADARILATLYPDGNTDAGARKMEDAVRLTIAKLTITSPCDQNGNGKIDDPDYNEFSYNADNPAKLHIPCTASITPAFLANNVLWNIEDIGTIQGVWQPHFEDVPSIGKGATAAVDFTGMPDNNGDFGLKRINAYYHGANLYCSVWVEVFFDPLARNNNGPQPDDIPTTIDQETVTVKIGN